MHRQTDAAQAEEQVEDDAAESTLIPQQDNIQQDDRQVAHDLTAWAFRSSWAGNLAPGPNLQWFSNEQAADADYLSS